MICLQSTWRNLLKQLKKKPDNTIKWGTQPTNVLQDAQPQQWSRKCKSCTMMCVTPIRGKKYNQKIPNAGEYVGSNENACALLVGARTVTASWKIIQQDQTWKYAAPLTWQSLYLYTLEKFFHTCTRSTLLKNIYSINTWKSPKWKQPKCPPQIKWKNIFWCIINGTLCSHLSGCTSKIWPAKKLKKGKSENYTVWFHLYQIQNEIINNKSRSD